MRIKHWAGYGCVNAKTNYRKNYKNGTTVTTVEVWGNHERGLEPRYFDKQDWERWLGKRFRLNKITYVCTDVFYENDVEHMVVTFESVDRITEHSL